MRLGSPDKGEKRFLLLISPHQNIFNKEFVFNFSVQTCFSYPKHDNWKIWISIMYSGWTPAYELELSIYCSFLLFFLADNKRNLSMVD